MTNSEFRKLAHELVDWIADYREQIEQYPVKSQVKPGEIKRQIADHAPEQGQDFEQIFTDFKTIIMPGMTHWQHPGFFAYFPSNASYPSQLAEMLMSAMAAQCMSWQTSPAATELEEQVMNWLAEMIGIPDHFAGVIQDTASTATLTALLSARERASNFAVNESGFSHNRYRIYCSAEAHSSIEKAVKIAGFGRNAVRKIAVDSSFALIPDDLRRAIADDKTNGYEPLAVVAAIGTTGSVAIDPLREIATICQEYDLWLHVDAAYAGTALVLPEFRWMIDGIEAVDSFVFNPHKWMFTNFDCSAYFVKSKEMLIRTFEILPEYLKTVEGDQVNNYRDWGIQLGRRFRALKLWFVIRSFGVAGIQEKLQKQLNLSKQIFAEIDSHPHFEILSPMHLNVICFRYHPEGNDDQNQLNELNARLMENVNATGKYYFTHTKLNGDYVIRFVIGQENTEEKHVFAAWKMLQEFAGKKINR